MQKTLFGNKLPIEVQRLILEFDPTAKEAMDRVLRTLVDRVYGYDFMDFMLGVDYGTIYNYPADGGGGIYEDEEGNTEVSVDTTPYFSVALQRMVPSHTAFRLNDEPVVITHYIPGRGTFPGRFMDAEILLPLFFFKYPILSVLIHSHSIPKKTKHSRSGISSVPSEVRLGPLTSLGTLWQTQ